jgi:tRNA pseudouridine55 synthase
MIDQFLLYKHMGETPLSCMNRFRECFPEYVGVSMTYAGRLDPLASGLLYILTRESCRQKDDFLGKDKEYQVDILFGIGTDTHDPLGVVGQNTPGGLISLQTIEKKLQLFQKTFEQKYPAYSSKAIYGKQLHTHARQGTIAEDDLPAHTVTIHNMQVIDFFVLPLGEIVERAQDKIRTVSGDFRQDESIQSWSVLLEKYNTDSLYPVVRICTRVSSGTYMRQLAYDVGKSLGVPALAWNIVRTKIFL